MAISTEETVRGVVVQAIQAIAQEGLGFDTPNGNVKGYLLDYEHPAKVRQYLMASVGARQQIQAWGVMVSAADVFVGTGGLVQRTYTIVVEGYYDLGLEGAGINSILVAARRIAAQLKNIGTSLYQTVDFVSNPVFESPQVVPSGIEKNSGQMVKARITYTASRKNPNF